MIMGQSLTQFRNTGLPGVECLAVDNALLGRVADEIRRRQVALAHPERNETFASASVIGNRHDTTFRRSGSFPTKIGDERHDFPVKDYDLEPESKAACVCENGDFRVAELE